MQTQSIQHIRTERFERVVAVALGLLVGTFLILGVGFAQPEAVHNAAHDTRHSTAFPCH